jgi:tetratricopeptide (TPR) repeat protein
MHILQHEKSLWVRRKDQEAKKKLMRIYGNQALILQTWGRPKEAMELLKKQKTLGLNIGDKNILQINYGEKAALLYTRGQLKEAIKLLKKQESF